MKRGDIWWANVPVPTGSGPGHRRPVVVVQSDPFNDSRISTVIVVILTSNLALSKAPGNVRLGKRESGLSKASVVNVSQIFTVDRSLLRKRVKMLRSGIMDRVDAGLAMVLGL